MSKKAKVILIIVIVLFSIVAVATLAIYILSLFAVDFNTTAKISSSVKSISDYSRYEDENEEPGEVIVHGNPDSPEQDLSDIVLPEDFSFKLAWGYGYCSYYNSKTGKMIRDNNEEEIEKYTKYVLLSEYELKMIYKLLFIDTDITTYPEEYDPSIENSSGTGYVIICPYRSFKITVYANGEEKTVDIDYFPSVTDNSTALVKSLGSILDFITSTPEWQAFPETTVRYM